MIEFEGSIILEKLSEQGLLDEFYEAVDSDDFTLVQQILESAGFESDTIEQVLEKMEQQGNE